MTDPDPTIDVPAATMVGAATDGSESCPRCGEGVQVAWPSCRACGQVLVAPAELEVGTRLADGRYQVLEVLGRGGFGITYDVGDRRLQRRVAMKELFPESAVRHGSMVLVPPRAREPFREARERFLREARVLARFTHPGIVRVYEVFEENGTAYLVMELLDGRTLMDLLTSAGRPFGEAELLDVAGRVAAALRPVHAAGVLHRDINPSNIILTRGGRIVVIDFGLARSYHEDHTAGVTRVVTPGYAPLEQYRGEGRFGPATDVHGLAATLYRLGTGRIPVPAVDRDAGASLTPAHQLNPALSKPVSDAISDGLELEPEHRPQDLDAFLARLGIRRLPESPRALLVDSLGPGEPTAADAPSPAPARSPSRAPSPDPGAEPTAVRAAGTEAAGADATRVVGRADGDDESGDRTRAVPPAPTPVDPPVPRAGLAPIAVGPHRAGRAKVTVPALIVGMAAGAALPVVATALVVLVVVPLVATVGDSVAHRLRRAHGVAGGWAERRLGPGALAPLRFVGNTAMSVFRASPLIGLGAALLAAWYALEGLDVAPTAMEWMLRGVGALTVGGILAASRVGSTRFRTGLGIDELVARWLPDGRANERVIIAWLVVAALSAGLLWLAPDPFPLP